MSLLPTSELKYNFNYPQRRKVLSKMTYIVETRTGSGTTTREVERPLNWNHQEGTITQLDTLPLWMLKAPNINGLMTNKKAHKSRKRPTKKELEAIEAGESEELD